MALDSLHELMLDELRDLYHAELQIAKSLPRIARAARTPRLREALREHQQDTERHVERLERVFDALGERGTGRRSRAMLGLLDEGLDLVDVDGSDAVRDAALISAIQRIEHYEIAAYGTVITHAGMLGHTRVARLLEESLREEKRADERLTMIAEEEVNRTAVEAGRFAEHSGERARGAGHDRDENRGAAWYDPRRGSEADDRSGRYADREGGRMGHREHRPDDDRGFGRYGSADARDETRYSTRDRGTDSWYQHEQPSRM